MSGNTRRTRRRAELSWHFLRKGATAAELVRSTSISSRDLVIEIGPGRGALTRYLVERTRHLVAVELDPDLCRDLRRELGSRAEVLHADFLDHTLPDRTYKVIGSLPFALTSRIVRKLTGALTPPDDAWLLVQREAAGRFAGSPYARETLGSLRLKPWWHVEITRTLRRTDFDPPPSVDCALLWLARRTRPLVEPRHADLYRRFAEHAFGAAPAVSRALRDWLTPAQIRRLARDLHFDPGTPPGALRFEQWLGLFRFIALEARRPGPRRASSPGP